MTNKSLNTIRALAIGVVLVSAPIAQACSENSQTAAQIGAEKMKAAQAKSEADKLAKVNAEKAQAEATRLAELKVANAKAEEARIAVADAKAAQENAGAAQATNASAKNPVMKVADAGTKAAVGAAAATGAATATAAANTAASANDEPEFTDAYMNDEANILAGGELWKQCRHCHGRSAYPGKAPKLKPKKYKPNFVYNRITKGFRKMPPWEAVFSMEQRMQLVAYIKSKRFSP